MPEEKPRWVLGLFIVVFVTVVVWLVWGF